MNEKEAQQNYVEDQVSIKHGLELLKEKYNALDSQTKDGMVKEYYATELPRTDRLIRQATQNIINGKP